MTYVGPKTPRVRDPGFLDFVRGRECVACHRAPPSDPAHIRMACEMYGKRHVGMAEKPSDRWVTPLCRKCHSDQHAFGSERDWWTAQGLDPFGISIKLFARYQAQGGGKTTTKKPKRRSRIATRGFPKGQEGFGK